MAFTKDDAVKRCRNAIMVLGMEHPHFLVIHARIRDLYQIAEGDAQKEVKTMGITSSGKIIMSLDFVEKLPSRQLGGVICHEMMHLVLMHHIRQGARDPKLWNIAADMCINHALNDGGIDLPSWCFYPPREYTGDLAVEPVYEYLQANPDKVPQGAGDMIMPGAGCAVIDDGQSGFTDSNGDVVDWRLVAADAVAQAKAAGKGGAAIARLIEQRQPKSDWRKIIRRGVSLAVARPGRDIQTMARRSRRSPPTGFQFPGWKGLSPRICVMADVSGSMNPDWVEQMLAECKAMIKQFSGVNIFFISHTSRVEWEGWITPTSTAKLQEAVQFSGGTDPGPAYESAAKQGKFDAIVHFTDTEFFQQKWPEFKARQLIVGLYGARASCPPPPGSVVIPCHTD